MPFGFVKMRAVVNGRYSRFFHRDIPDVGIRAQWANTGMHVTVMCQGSRSECNRPRLAGRRRWSRSIKNE